MAETVINVVLPALIVLAVASRGFRVDDRYMDRWASSAQLQLTAENRPVVRRYLARSRRFRTTGALVGFLAPTIIESAHSGTSRAGGWALPLMLVGYLLGALVAEIAFNRSRPRPGGGAALLVPRRLQDYLPGYVLVLQRGLAAASVVIASVYASFPHGLTAALVPDELHAFGNMTRWLASSLGLMVFAVVALLVWAGIEWFQRLITGRSQPAMSAGELAVDDAMRSSSLHVVAGAGIGLLLNLLALEVTVFQAALLPSAPSFLNWLLPLMALVLWVASIAFWLDLSKPHGFSVRRARPQELPA